VSSSGIGDRVSTAVTELYGADPQEFTDRRKALAAAARAGGDAAAAKRIAALRKPTRAAWVVNRLARADPGAPARLAALGAALRAAEEARDGPRLRELSAARGALIDELTGQALAAAGVTDPSYGLREEVQATLTSALADPDVAAEFAAGALTRAAQWAGFGTASFGFDSDAAAPETSSLAEAPPAPAAPRPRQSASSRTPAPSPPPPSAAEEAARQAARRREIYADAERAVASAEATTAAAVDVEDRLEAEVWDLEERLTRARTALADARLRARRAEAAERKARQALDRLPRP
jgi:hypothetical protein